MKKDCLAYAIIHLFGAILLFGILALLALSNIPLFFPLSEIIGVALVCVLLGIGYCLWAFLSGVFSFITGKPKT